MNGWMMQQPLLISIAADATPNATTASRRSFRVASKATSIATPTASSRRARASVANALAQRWASASATASPRWPGTATGTWSCTTACPVPARCCTRSTRACTPTRSVWIADHAEDQILFFDLTFLPLVEAIASRVQDDQGTSSR